MRRAGRAELTPAVLRQAMMRKCEYQHDPLSHQQCKDGYIGSTQVAASFCCWSFIALACSRFFCLPRTHSDLCPLDIAGEHQTRKLRVLFYKKSAAAGESLKLNSESADRTGLPPDLNHRELHRHTGRFEPEGREGPTAPARPLCTTQRSSHRPNCRWAPRILAFT